MSITFLTSEDAKHFVKSINGNVPDENGNVQVAGSGKDGVSCTHEWNGSILTVTSASGTSSADLKGEKGDAYVLTEADKEEIIDEVKMTCVAKNQGVANVGKILTVGTDGNLTLVAMPSGGGDITGTVDNNNNILLSGSLASGTYILKYENADGSYTEVGTLEVGAIPEPEPVVNLIPTALATNLTEVYNGKGYKENTRISNSSNGEKEDTNVTKNYILTGLIPLGNENDVFHIRGVSRIGYITSSHSGSISFWDENGAYISNSMMGTPEAIQGTDSNGDFTITMDYSDLTVPANTAYVRFQFGEVIGDFIMTRNQLISV